MPFSDPDKIWQLAAALIGSLVPLSFMRQLKVFTAMTVIGTNAVFATFGAPALAKYLEVEQVLEYVSFITFLVALVGFPVAGGLVKLASQFKDNPDQFVKRKKED